MLENFLLYFLTSLSPVKTVVERKAAILEDNNE